MIDLKQISAGYGPTRILQDVSAVLEPGCLTGIIGVNGSGKSTLLKAMLGMIPLQSGGITVDGSALRHLTRQEIARKIAYLAQGKATPDMTVEQLVLHGRFPHLQYPRRYTKRDRDIAVLAMEQLGIADLARKPLHTLSGGMRQNAYLAMALAQDTPYMLLDEPMSYLDIGHQLELMRLLRTLAHQGKGVVAVMHDLPMALTFSDHILLMDQGRILGSGTPDQIFRQGCLGRVFGVDLRQEPDGRYSYQY